MQKETMLKLLQRRSSLRRISSISSRATCSTSVSAPASDCATGIPFFGLYGACSTMAEGLSLASMVVEGGFASRCIALTSSHFASAERQFRFPMEYGGSARRAHSGP